VDGDACRPVASPGAAAASPTDPGWRRRLPGWLSPGQRDGSAVAFSAVGKFWQANTAGALRRELRSQTRSSPKLRHASRRSAASQIDDHACRSVGVIGNAPVAKSIVDQLWIISVNENDRAHLSRVLHSEPSMH
jgi:hypothetical protein